MTTQKVGYYTTDNTAQKSVKWKDNPGIFNKIRNTCYNCWQNICIQCSFSECLPKRTIVIQSPPFAQEDEDELFGRTIALMLRKMPPIEKNLLKIQIFSCVAAAQNRINRDEYLV